ncbi:MAG: hypothetical protein KJP07_05865, partial [Desulfatitalea sp.]|nr:hypothetical protein [Desulfatitalea sp.]
MSDIYFKTPSKGTNVRVFDYRRKIIGALLWFCWRSMPNLTRWVLTHSFMAPTTYRLNAEETACLDRGRLLRLPVHDKQVHAWQWGKGPGVLMVHGWNGGGAQFHRFVEPIVRAGYSAIAIDGPG